MTIETGRRSIFVTGGASGIGRATARLFAQAGWRVGIADVDAAGMAATLAGLAGPGHAAFPLDVRDRDGWAAALAAFTAPDDGALWCLFNNAGIPAGGPFADIAFAELDRVVAVNLVGVLNGARIGHAHLAKAAPGSCLINTASASAIYGSPGLATYSATKFAVRGLTEALDGEWAAAGIAVRAVLPGFVDTPLLAQPTAGSNRSIRETVLALGLELTGADAVARAVWDAVHGRRVLRPVGPTARQMAFAARWFPERLRRRLRTRG